MAIYLVKVWFKDQKISRRTLVDSGYGLRRWYMSRRPNKRQPTLNRHRRARDLGKIYTIPPIKEVGYKGHILDGINSVRRTTCKHWKHLVRIVEVQHHEVVHGEVESVKSADSIIQRSSLGIGFIDTVTDVHGCIKRSKYA